MYYHDFYIYLFTYCSTISSVKNILDDCKKWKTLSYIINSTIFREVIDWIKM